MATANQNPEQVALDQIDRMLVAAGWAVQGKNGVDFGAGLGLAVREYQTDIWLADYVLFVDRRAVGVNEAKREEEGQHLIAVEDQSGGYVAAELKGIENSEQLPFVCEEHRADQALCRRARSEAEIK